MRTSSFYSNIKTQSLQHKATQLYKYFLGDVIIETEWCFREKTVLIFSNFNKISYIITKIIIFPWHYDNIMSLFLSQKTQEYAPRIRLWSDCSTCCGWPAQFLSGRLCCSYCRCNPCLAPWVLLLPSSVCGWYDQASASTFQWVRQTCFIF